MPPPDYNSHFADEINLEVIKTNSPEDPHILKGIIRHSEKNYMIGHNVEICALPSERFLLKSSQRLSLKFRIMLFSKINVSLTSL